MKARPLNKRTDILYFSNGAGLWRIKNGIPEFCAWNEWYSSCLTLCQFERKWENNIKRVSKLYAKEHFPKAFK